MGVRDEDIIPIKLNVFAANGVLLEVLGGIPIKLSLIPKVGGKTKESHQLAYVAVGVHQLFMIWAYYHHLGIQRIVRR